MPPGERDRPISVAPAMGTGAEPGPPALLTLPVHPCPATTAHAVVVTDAMTIGLLMPDSLLHDSMAGPPVETAPDGPDTANEDRTDTEATAVPLPNPLKRLGSDDAAVCSDGVCAL